MAETPTDRKSVDTLTFADFKFGVASLTTTAWAILLLFVVLSMLTSLLTGRTPQDLGPFFALVLLILTTPFVLIFAVPPLFKRYMRRRRALRHGERNS